MKAFRDAVLANDIDAVGALFADDIVFTSPVAFAPYPGKPIAYAIIEAVMGVFEGFHYVREIGHDGDADTALVFEATVDGKSVNGCDFIHVNDEGLIDSLTVMVRPLSGANALSAAMGARFESIKERAAAMVAMQS
ncbi:nuclear transport factor 2 family protein [Gordonia sp. TBRC 11910]|uniref:Nuclear transport factor 2 family protein n=1 Tax=Gordonia asplenii TaxID=2725283 RepID=A0A848KP08_9ACTN|nr:nuclear transport factor 2 family protein [Gordonia asplenii]NMO00030.1 nuclear transport factor 2 family protein [Gordonia asplenii]